MYSNLDKTKIAAGLSDLDELARQQAYIEEAKGLVAKIAEEKGSPLTCHVATFGCQMNARDSEKLLGILIEAGYQPIDTEDADLVVYNTCTSSALTALTSGKLRRVFSYRSIKLITAVRVYPDKAFAIYSKAFICLSTGQISLIRIGS